MQNKKVKNKKKTRVKDNCFCGKAQFASKHLTKLEFV